jgi:secondary thiamine-phosphate synthase enzyme
MYQTTIECRTGGRGTTEITREVAAAVNTADVDTGLCHVFIRHTSASLIITENADPAVRRDLDRFLAHLVPDGDPLFEHDAEGPDDMPAHVRSVLTQTGLAVPIVDGHLALGTWQGIFVWEHRTAPNRRKVIITVDGR